MWWGFKCHVCPQRGRKSGLGHQPSSVHSQGSCSSSPECPPVPTEAGGRWGPAFPRKSLPVCVHTDNHSLAKILLCEVCAVLCARLRGTPVHALEEGVWRPPGPGLGRRWLLPQLRQPGSLQDCAVQLGDACASVVGVEPPPRHRLALGVGAGFPHRLRDAGIPRSGTPSLRQDWPQRKVEPLPRGGNVGSVTWRPRAL